MRTNSTAVQIRILIALALVSLGFMWWGCAASPPSAPSAQSAVQVADPGRVAECQYLGKVSAGVELDKATDFLNLWKERGLEKCQAECLDQAHTKGATHLVWDQLHSDLAVGRIYRCTP